MKPLQIRRPAWLACLTSVLCIAAAAPAHAAPDGWTATGSLATPRGDHTATLLGDGTVLAVGGRTSGFAPVSSVERYDPVAGAWTPAASMATARFGHTATLLAGPACSGAVPPAWCGKVLVAGGANDAGAELYDPVGGWTPTGSLAQPRRDHTATPLGDGRVLVAGGESPSGPGRFASAEIYDPGTGTWTATGSLATARSDHVAVRLGDGKVLAATGAGSDGASLTSAELFDPATGGWAPAGSLQVARQRAVAVLLGEGRALVIGGSDTGGTPRRSTEAYDPVGGAWADGGSLNVGRAFHTATVLAGGAVLVAGSVSSGGDLASSELLSGGAWAHAAPMGSPRSRHTATSLAGPRCGPSCGRVLVAGGRNDITPLASAELFGTLPQPLPPPPAGAVADLAATSLSARRIRLSFSAPASPDGSGAPAQRFVVKQSGATIGEASFPSRRALCGGICRFAPVAVGQRITLTVTGLAANRRYHYALKALGGAGNSGAISNPASARTRRDRIRPGRATRLSARGLRGAVRLSFRAPASDGRTGPPVRHFEVRQSLRPLSGRSAFRRAVAICRRTCRFSPRRVGARLTLNVRRLCGSRLYFFAVRPRDEGGNLGPTSRFRPASPTGRGTCRRSG